MDSSSGLYKFYLKIGAFLRIYWFPSLIALIVGVFSLSHRPFGSFDETNTLRIVSQPVQIIFRILSEESNLPIFYVLLKFVRTLLFNNDFLLQFLYLISYLLSGVFFYKIVTNFSKDSKYKSFLLGLYYSLPAVVYNAYYIRMYNLGILIGMIAFWALVDFSSSKSNKSILFAVALLSLGMLLHPMGILWGAMLFSLLFFKELTKKQRMYILIALLVGAIGWLSQILIKADLIRIFFVGGPKYMIEAKDSISNSGLFYYFYSVFLRQINQVALIVFPLFVVVLLDMGLLYKAIVKRGVTQFLDKIALVSFLIFFLTPVVLNAKIYLHHMHYLLPFGVFATIYALFAQNDLIRVSIGKTFQAAIGIVGVLVSIVLVVISEPASLNNMSIIALIAGTALMLCWIYIPELKTRIVLLLQLFMLFLTIMYYCVLTPVGYASRCSYIHSEVQNPGTYFFMQHNYANLYLNCLKSKKNIVLLDENRELFYLQKHTDKEVLIEQAIRGGSLGTYDEMQSVFSKDTSLMQYNINRLSVKLEADAICNSSTQSTRHLEIKGFTFIKCGTLNEYVYEKSQ